MDTALVLVNYKDYYQKYLADCLGSLRAQNYSSGFKIFVVANETSEEGLEYLKKEMPEAELIINPQNDGFAKGNNDAMRRALAQGFKKIVLFNLDTIIDVNCLTHMSLALDSNPKIGAVQARLMLHPEIDLVNSLGNATHFLGFGYCLGYRHKYLKKLPAVSNIMYASGAAVMFRAEALKEAGLFDEKFWMYNEDQDLSWRLWLLDWRVVLAESAVVYHKYEFSRSISKYYFMERNRAITILKNYKFGTLLLIFPAWLVMELGLFLFAIRGGWADKKIKAWAYFLKAKNWQYILGARRQIQRHRKMSDDFISRMIVGRIWYQEIASFPLRVANLFLSVYWQLIKVLIRW